MITRKTDPTMTIQIEASELLERAEIAHDAAIRWARTMVADAPLAVELKDMRRIERAREELEAAQAALAAAKDLPCPEA